MLRKMMLCLVLNSFLLMSSVQSFSNSISSDNINSLQKIKHRGYLKCGIGKSIYGFSIRQKKGKWKGFDIDWCRAFAAAIFKNPDQVKFIPVTTSNRFDRLIKGDIDILMRSTSWTFSRDVDLPLEFPVVIYYDSQGVMTRRSLDISAIQELHNARICVAKNSTGQKNLQDYAKEHQINFEIVVFKSAEQARNAYEAMKCDAYSDDLSALAVSQSNLNKPGEHMILSDAISKEWFSPVIQEGADRLADLVRWTVYALINAEEYAITRQNIDELRDFGSQRVKRILGSDQGFSDGFENPNYAYHAIKAVGNYGEIFERNLGLKSKYKIERGLNKLWTDRGQIYAPPIR